MKKNLLFFLLICFSFPLSAELYDIPRNVEFGIDLNLQANQNLFSVNDFFVENIVLDFTEICEGMDENGFAFNSDGNLKLSGDFRTQENFSVGGFINLQFFANTGISKDFFDFLGKGNKDTPNFNTTLNLGAEAYLEYGVPVRAKFDKLKIHAIPSVFLPIIYLPNPEAQVYVSMQDDGTILSSVYSEFSLYSLCGLQTCFDKHFHFQSADNLIDAFSFTDTLFSLGIDLSACVEYEFNEFVTGAAYTHLPVIPGSLKNETHVKASYGAAPGSELKINPLLNGFLSDDGISFNIPDDYSAEAEYLKTNYYINRPFRLGVEFNLKPFGNWFTFRPVLGFAIKNPFGTDFSWENSIYPEYSFGIEITFLYVLKFIFATEYKHQVFMQKAGISINAYVLQIDINVSSSSSSFEKSWEVSGCSLNLGVRFGA